MSFIGTVTGITMGRGNPVAAYGLNGDAGLFHRRSMPSNRKQATIDFKLAIRESKHSSTKIWTVSGRSSLRKRAARLAPSDERGRLLRRPRKYPGGEAGAIDWLISRKVSGRAVASRACGPARAGAHAPRAKTVARTGTGANRLHHIVCLHISDDLLDSFVDYATANGLEFVEVQFANMIGHVSLLLCLRRDNPLTQSVVAGVRGRVRFRCDPRHNPKTGHLSIQATPTGSIASHDDMAIATRTNVWQLLGRRGAGTPPINFSLFQRLISSQHLKTNQN